MCLYMLLTPLDGGYDNWGADPEWNSVLLFFIQLMNKLLLFTNLFKEFFYFISLWVISNSRTNQEAT